MKPTGILRYVHGSSLQVLILHNHGVVAMGNSIEEAFYYTFHLLRACEIQVSKVHWVMTICIIPSYGVADSLDFAVCHPHPLIYGVLPLTDNEGCLTWHPSIGMEVLMYGSFTPSVNKICLTTTS